MEAKGVHTLCAELMTGLVDEMPADPLDFMVHKLAGMEQEQNDVLAILRKNVTLKEGQGVAARRVEPEPESVSQPRQGSGHLVRAETTTGSEPEPRLAAGPDPEA